MKRLAGELWFMITDWANGGSRRIHYEDTFAKTLREVDSNWGSGFSGMNKEGVHNLVINTHENYAKSINRIKDPA